MHEYSRDQFRDCVGGRRLVFAGDSTTRQVFWAAAQRLDHKKAEVEYLDLFVSDNPQRDISFEAEGVQLQFVWDPWLNSTRLFTQLDLLRRAQAWADGGPSKDVGEDEPALVVMGAPGLFSARHGGDSYLDIFKHSLDGVMRYLTQPLGPGALVPRGYRELENQILLAPVPIPSYQKLTAERRATLTPQRLDRMNEYLRELPDPASSRVMWAYNQMTDHVGMAFDQNGMHVNEGLAERRIDVVLNVRCNAGLVKHGFANKRTCCVGYPPLATTQALLLLTAASIIPALMWARRRNLRSLVPYLPSQSTLSASLTLLGCAMYCYFTDRTHALVQAEKHFSEFTLAALWAGLFTLSVCSLRRTTGGAKPGPSKGGLGPSEAEVGFLSRPQSEEWKGLMQTGLLLMSSQQTSGYLSLYKITRLFAACYIFMSTYGHARYFLRTGDFSFRRVATVLFRLNFMSCLLSLVLKSDWTVYAFPWLISFWFLVTFATFRVLVRFGDRPELDLAKVLAVGVATNILLVVPGTVEACVLVFRILGRVSLDAALVRRQISMDSVIPFLGMLVAWVAHRVSTLKTSQAGSRPSNAVDKVLAAIFFPDRSTPSLQPIVAALSLACLLLFFYATQLSSRYPDVAAYDRAHAYISPAAALAYAVLRNCHRTPRNMHMLLAAPLGRMALEAYLLQHHAWLAGDGTGLLRTGLTGRAGGGGGGWFSRLGRGSETVLLTATFLCLSWLAHEATRRLAAAVFGEGSAAAAAAAPPGSGLEDGIGEGYYYEAGPMAGVAGGPARQAAEKDGSLGSAERVGSRGPAWLSQSRARAGVLVVLLWLGNIFNG